MESETIKNTIQGVIDGLTPLAQKLQVPIEGLFSWALRHNYAIAISEAVAFVFALVLVILLVKFFQWGLGKDEGRSESRFYNNEGLVVIACVASFLVGVVMIILTVALFSDSIPRLVAPEWYATKDIVQMIGIK